MSTCFEASVRSTADSKWGVQQIKHKQESIIDLSECFSKSLRMKKSKNKVKMVSTTLISSQNSN